MLSPNGRQIYYCVYDVIWRDLNVFCDDNMLLAGVSELRLVKMFLAVLSKN